MKFFGGDFTAKGEWLGGRRWGGGAAKGLQSTN